MLLLKLCSYVALNEYLIPNIARDNTDLPGSVLVIAQRITSTKKTSALAIINIILCFLCKAHDEGSVVSP